MSSDSESTHDIRPLCDGPKFAIVALWLPDGRIVVQRRTLDAPYGPGKLGLFGGWVDEGETPDECIRREIAEETSLIVDTLDISSVANFTVPASSDFSVDRQFSLYATVIPHPNFVVYEGQGAEVFTCAEFAARDDLILTAGYAREYLLSR